MYAKRLLIIAPLVLLLGLAQSYLWVPSYEQQTAGNPARLRKFIEASIGDARILNPILNADSASSRIVGLVFDGLLDLDEDLNLRPRLARSWRLREEAFLLVDTGARFPDGTAVTPPELRARLARAAAEREDLRSLVTEVRLLPARTRVERVPAAAPGREQREVELTVRTPPRVRLRLTRVEPDLLARLRPLLGPGYGRALPYRRWVRVAGDEMPASVASRLPELVPLLEHNPIIDFELRRGVRFHDGHEFDAGDVKFTYQAIMDPRNLSPRTSDFEPIKALEVKGRYAVEVRYKRLFSPAINAWTIGILPEHLLGRDAPPAERGRPGGGPAPGRPGLRDRAFNRNPVGTGPFRFVEWQSDELIHLRRNDDYWERPPEYRDYYYRVIPDALTQEVEFRTGAIDTYRPQPHQVARYRGDDRYQSFSSVGFGYTYIGYNNRRAPFTDKRVRRALGMAINVDEIIEYVLYGEGERTTGPYPRNTTWYDPEVRPLPYDPAAAVRLLGELGWRRNAGGWLEKEGKVFEFNLVTNNGNPVRKAIMTVAQNGWRKIGIRVTTQVFEWAVFLQDFVNTGDFDALILGWSMGADPDLYQIWHSSQSGPNQLNFVGFANPAADDLIVRIRREYDRERQRAMARRLHRLIAGEQPYTFLFAGLGTRVLDRKIVMLEEDGSYARLRAARSGDPFYFMNRWRKLERAPRF